MQIPTARTMISRLFSKPVTLKHLFSATHSHSFTKACINFLIFILFTGNLYSQWIAGIGAPLIKHYSPNEIFRSPQVSCGLQDKRGVIYFGANSGVLEFDGTSWKRYINSNRSVIRSMALDSLGTLYVGGVNEFGYLKPNPVGELEYFSISQLLPEKERDFQNVWNIHCTEQGIYFMSPKTVFRFYKNAITKIKADLAGFCSFEADREISCTPF